MLPSIESTEKLPTYSKPIKGIMEEQKSIEKEDPFNTDTFYKVIILNQTTQKIRDPKSFMMLIKTETIKSDRALSDLGMGFNRLALSINKELGLRELKSTHVLLEPPKKITIQLKRMPKDGFLE